LPCRGPPAPHRLYEPHESALHGTRDHREGVDEDASRDRLGKLSKVTSGPPTATVTADQGRLNREERGRGAQACRVLAGVAARC
jgi:hypothetical protein